MFQRAIHNITGDPPYNLEAFPMLIGVGIAFATTHLCKTPKDIPQETDFVILSTGLYKNLKENPDD